MRRNFVCVFLLLTFLFFACSYKEAKPPCANHLHRLPSKESAQQEPELTIERARDALIEMMKVSDNIHWGSQKEWTHEELVQVYGGDTLGSDPVLLEKIIGNPPPMPGFMNHIEIRQFDDGDEIIKIGYWSCDLKKRHFSEPAGRGYMEGDLHVNIPSEYEGEFYLDSSGKWKARYWKVEQYSE